ncbi:MAG: tetratricopeptide repeat protein [Verrucomicrobiota bacterium]|nr:tetratricopeptide repeat protein [Verrucomicrobiota bacterium]
MPTAAPSSTDPLLETQVLWTRYKTPVIATILVIILGFAGYGIFRIYSERRNEAAATSLANAKNPADFEKVIADFPHTGAALTAYLFLAEQQRENQQFAAANTTLQKFVDAYPKDELVATAKMAMAANLDSMGKANEALALYRAIAAGYPQNYNASTALLMQAQFLKHDGKNEEAQRVCETIMAQYRESYASMEAAAMLKTLKPAPTPMPLPLTPSTITPASSPAAQTAPATSPAPQSAPAASAAPSGKPKP